MVSLITSPLKERLTAKTTPERSRGNWFTDQRLRFIEARLFWTGRVNRGDLVETFGIHTSIASADIAAYRDLAPRNAVYDASGKTYRPGKLFQPIFEFPSLERLLGHVLLKDELPSKSAVFEWLTPPDRQIDPALVRNIRAAAEDQSAIYVLYRSMREPNGAWRWIEPHSVVFDGKRWHVRAFCCTRESFRDFVLSRFEDAKDIRKAVHSSSDDGEWNEIVKVSIKAHDKLSEEQRKLVARDFGMVRGLATISVRKALLRYLLLNLGLDVEQDPPRLHIQLVNPELRIAAGFI